MAFERNMKGKNILIALVVIIIIVIAIVALRPSEEPGDQVAGDEVGNVPASGNVEDAVKAVEQELFAEGDVDLPDSLFNLDDSLDEFSNSLDTQL